MKMKILNLFAGIGGNRALWGTQHEITAVDHNQQIAMIYLKRFPKDKVIVGDAYDYLLKNYKFFDIIWASPPCQTHSGCNTFLHPQGIVRYPDFRLYELIIFLKTWSKSNWIVENVKPYYSPLIKPTTIRGRHYYWSNVPIPSKKKGKSEIGRFKETEKSKMLGKRPNANINQIERNKVSDIEGKLILTYLLGKKQMELKLN